MTRKMTITENVFANSVAFITAIKKSAFTLAEVLIVLAIIGVVAAICLPALMTKTYDAELKVSAKKAFSVTSAAVKHLQYDDETSQNTDYLGQKLYKKLAEYLSISTLYGTDNNGLLSYQKVGSTYKTLSGKTDFLVTLFDDGQFMTTNGTFYMFENSYTLSRIYISVDVNGPYKKPNVIGRDVFLFQLNDSQLLPMGADSTDYPASKFCNRKQNSGSNGFGCMYYVLQGIDY